MMSVELNRQYNTLPHYTKTPGNLPAIFSHPHPRSLYPTTGVRLGQALESIAEFLFLFLL